MKIFFVFTIFILNPKGNCLETGYIIGGNKSNIVNFPYAAFLAAETKNAAYICGSAVLNQYILLTAAHCLFKFIGKPYDMLAFAGGDDLRTATSIRKLRVVLIHEQYNDNQLSNDLCITKVSKPFTIGEFVKRTIIARIFPNVNTGIVAGWGIIDEHNNKHVSKLKHVQQRIQSEAVCAYIVGILSDTIFCAGSFESNDPRPSVGDSGSAFIVQDFIQVGVLSFRAHDTKAISVYTNITTYYDWIKQNTLRLICVK